MGGGPTPSADGWVPCPREPLSHTPLCNDKAPAHLRGREPSIHSFKQWFLLGLRDAHLHFHHVTHSADLPGDTRPTKSGAGQRPDLMRGGFRPPALARRSAVRPQAQNSKGPTVQRCAGRGCRPLGLSRWAWGVPGWVTPPVSRQPRKGHTCLPKAGRRRREHRR